MENQLINRGTLKAAIKKRGNYREISELLNISVTALSYKINGRKGRGILPFTEEEIQILRSYFDDSILYPAPIAEQPEMIKKCHREAKQ